ncbi:AraC family transcriptional regulator [Caballeronia sp. LP006]|uniref:helix-turn-helix transcriptional regulator n=1 Tax=Caballeronia sp. LP006 TaxID=3038552 RepID=UPI00285DE630|nr:AraC family transcriptional regulator [Caballeronia sp. LP006]MDR5827194.1 AraC family transcriptional regulator [Caballeronia sp. LP006]
MKTPLKADTHIWRAPELGAELLRGRFADFSYDVHAHDTACFALLTGGAIRIRMRGTEFVARRGDLYAIDADEPHAGWPVDEAGWTQRTLYVDVAHLRALAGDERMRGGGLIGPIIRDPALCAALHDVHRSSEEQGPSLYRDERYLQFAARLTGRHMTDRTKDAKAPREPRAVAAARGFIDERLGEQVHLEDIAEAANLPPYRLFRAFSRETGMTPHEYQRQARVRVAMALIRDGGALSDIAAATGFADQAHLTRTFRRMLGVTPGAYKTATR